MSAAQKEAKPTVTILAAISKAYRDALAEDPKVITLGEDIGDAEGGGAGPRRRTAADRAARGSQSRLWQSDAGYGRVGPRRLYLDLIGHRRFSFGSIVR